MADQTKPTTTDTGMPVASDEHSLTIGTDGPIVLHDHYLLEQMQPSTASASPNASPMPRAAVLSATSKSPATPVRIPRPQYFSPARRLTL